MLTVNQHQNLFNTYRRKKRSFISSTTIPLCLFWWLFTSFLAMALESFTIRNQLVYHLLMEKSLLPIISQIKHGIVSLAKSPQPMKNAKLTLWHFISPSLKMFSRLCYLNSPRKRDGILYTFVGSTSLSAPSRGSNTSMSSITNGCKLTLVLLSPFLVC